MSFKHGRNADLWLNGKDVQAYFRALDLDVGVEPADTTTFGNAWKRAIAGLAEYKIDAGGLFDATFTDIWHLIGADPGAVLTAGPSGLAVGDMCRLLSIASTAYKESAPVGDVVSFDASFVADGVAGFGHVIAAMAAVTADQNVTHFDGTAASTTGAIAHLHVTSVSSADSIVVAVQDASVPTGGGANWATIGTFASKSAVGAERLVINGTVRRYLRVVDDVTGSSVSIVRGVALART